MKPNNKPYTTEVKGVKYIVNGNIVINTKNGITMELEEFEKTILKSDKKGVNNKFKNEWLKLDDNEANDIMQSVSNNIDNFVILEDVVGLQNNEGYLTKNNVLIVIDKTNINNSFIFRTFLETSKDGNVINNMNTDGFTPYSIKNGITNTMLFYSNIMDCNKELLTALNFNDCGDGIYINSDLNVITDISEDYLYFKEIGKEIDKPSKKQFKVFSFK